MKRLLNNVFIIAAASLLLTSCLKDKGYTDIMNDDNAPVVAFAVPGGVQSQTLLNQAEAQTFEVLFGLSTKNRTGDVTITISKDDASVAAGFLAYPSANVTITPSTLTFKPGDEYLPVTVTVINTNQFDACTLYMIPLVAITEGSNVVAATNQKALISVPVASAYSGDYHATGYFDHPTSPRDIDQDKTLSTVDCVTVSSNVGDLGITDDFELSISVDTVTNKVTLGNLGAGPAVEQINDATSNFYDPETKTFDLNYRYLGGTGFRTINEILTKQ